MRTRNILAPTLVLVLTGLWLALPAIAAEVPIEKSAKVMALPAVVQKTVLAEGAGATVRGVVTEKGEDGATVYEVEMRIKGLTKDIVVGADGTVLVSEQQVTLASIPAAVKTTILKASGKRTIRMIESVTKVGTLEYYEAHVVSGKTVTEVKVDPDGTLVP